MFAVYTALHWQPRFLLRIVTCEPYTQLLGLCHEDGEGGGGHPVDQPGQGPRYRMLRVRLA